MATRLSDADQLAEVVRGWDLDFRQLDCGGIDAHLAHVAAGSVLITECSMTRQIEQRGASPSGFRTIAIPANDAMAVRWRAEDHDGKSLMLFPKGGELDSISDSQFHVFTVSVAEERLRSVVSRRGNDVLDRFESGSGVVACSSETRLQLRKLAGHLVESATARPGILASKGYQEVLEGDLIDHLLDAIDGAAESESRPMARVRSAALRKAIEVIEDRAAEPVTISEVERLSGASTRTLRYAFQETFGVSPKQYLQAHRLNQVRRELRRSDPLEVKIADVANEWGFWHMGQFAADYRKMFGLLPSETLAGRR